MTIPKRGRWNRATVIVVKDTLGNDVRKPYLLPVKPQRRVDFADNRVYQPQRGDTWDRMAFRFFGDNRLWWILCDFNRVVDPYRDLEMRITTGTPVVVPSLSRVNFEVLRFGRNRSLT